MPSRLYVRTTLGLGVLVSKTGSESTGVASADQDQPSFAADVLIGAELEGRAAWGGALLFESGVPQHTGNSNEAPPGRRPHMALLGLFWDAYPFAWRGGHLGGAAGLSWASFAATGAGLNRLESFGPGAAVWFGEDLSLSSHWTIGPLIRLMAERGVDTEGSPIRPWAQSLTLSLSAVYR